MRESSLPITVVPEAERQVATEARLCVVDDFVKRVVRSCAAWNIHANDNDNHINDDNTRQVRNNHAKCDFRMNFNTTLLLQYYCNFIGYTI